ncbi:hypothetical protein [Hymenobacter wooponensis]|uniref:Uncharacterized protein n=1 Tax=Hymenobacter wooponensis TaxID=1525360 RepID=A0A4Z0MKG9_9BACT|nr:hypothetical protein [Hymenobacter wooponensis]TGD79808.1 hypothetical protein EU557_16485 [Hymenobacter wooponensis]
MYINTLLAWARTSLLVICCFGGSYYFTRPAHSSKRATTKLPKIDYRLSAVRSPAAESEPR